eukprot:TRINITY_DN3294_c3_g2_i1.p1 TRINITY_DN3294_c3_g2~~TRINITY_DN3294_c3_g2_i1.p1  ORF type:complete len:299 (+),score=75.27 TRINITY_DN3294_c3_g2_i1:146-1042(+)
MNTILFRHKILSEYQYQGIDEIYVEERESLINPINISLDNVKHINNEPIPELNTRYDNKSKQHLLVQSIAGFNPNIEHSDYQILSFRYYLNVIGNTLYDKKEKWSFEIYKPNDNDVIIFGDHGECFENSFKNETMVKCMRIGRWFEELLTGINFMNDKHQECFERIKVNIGGVICKLVCEIDGINENGELVEIKTSKLPKNYKFDSFYGKKLRKTWLQCSLGGVENVVYGFHDMKLLRKIEMYRTCDLPDISDNRWDPQCITEFIKTILNKIVETCPSKQKCKLIFEPMTEEIVFILL